MDMSQQRKYRNLVAIADIIFSKCCVMSVMVIFLFVRHVVTNADEVNHIYKEANSNKKLKHKNIVELYHAFVEGTKLIMIMELARGGELMDYVANRGKLPEPEARKIILQIINAMQYCHA